MIFEQCGCGAAIKAWRYWQVLEWRMTHVHLERTEDVMVPPQGGMAQVELAQPRYYDDTTDNKEVPLVIGFRA